MPMFYPVVLEITCDILINIVIFLPLKHVLSFKSITMTIPIEYHTSILVNVRISTIELFCVQKDARILNTSLV